ncbi:hypothetical protein EB796_014280 [Bugula neritina]|uniref:Uncharacterized protein n=1 Tax=Bugula neritina TaxID=10212 RepID=A0A7J7JM25_BUGNE|nr:hypothetical protein EB796_014280 [Bugula neritina]
MLFNYFIAAAVNFNFSRYIARTQDIYTCMDAMTQDHRFILVMHYICLTGWGMDKEFVYGAQCCTCANERKEYVQPV